MYNVFRFTLGGLLVVAACVPKPPERRDPMAGFRVTNPDVKKLSVAVILSENTKNSIDFGQKAAILSSFDAKATFDRGMERLRHNFARAPMVDGFEAAKTEGTDLVLILDAFVESNGPSFKVDHELIFLTPDGAEVTRLKASKETELSFNALIEMDETFTNVNDQIGRAVRASKELIEYSRNAYGADVPTTSEALAVSTATRVLVLEFETKGDVAGHVANLVTKLLLARLDDVNNLTTVSAADVEAMLDAERRKDLLGCGSASCFAEIGGALGAGVVVYGDLGRIGSQYNINVAAVDTQAATVRGRVSALVEADEDAIVAELPNITQKLIAKLNREAGAN